MALVKFVDAGVIKFSPREIFYIVIGAISLVSGMREGSAQSFIIGITFMVLGLYPFRLIPPEQRLIDAILFYMRPRKDKAKKTSKTKGGPMYAGGGMLYSYGGQGSSRGGAGGSSSGSRGSSGSSNDNDNDDDKNNDSIGQNGDNDRTEEVTVHDLETPHTLTLRTSETQQFVPVTVSLGDTIISSTVTGRKGKVTCTIMVAEYGAKRVTVRRKGDDQTIYDMEVRFVK